MESQKFIRAYDSQHFEIDDWFVQSIGNIADYQREGVLKDILSSIEYLPEKDGWSQMVGGVIRGKNPLFYLVEYLKEKSDPVLFLDVEEITSDEYLDLILENNTIEYHARASTRGV